MIKKVVSVIRARGIIGLIQAISSHFYIRKSKYHSMVKEIVSEDHGIEIGGPSSLFQEENILPIYRHITTLDNCNFSSNTVWEGEINKGSTYNYSKAHKPGRQYVLEATDLHEIKDETYEFLLSSHVIEHIANPIKALKEWIRILKTGGHLILLIPHKDGTFDHKRPVTTLKHLIKDFNNHTTEKDLTHLEEILELHDLMMDPEAGTYQEFAERSKSNYENRCLHHHVFNSHLAVELIDFLNLTIKSVEAIAPMHILIVAQNPVDGAIPDNKRFFDLVKSSRYNSPFLSDKT